VKLINVKIHTEIVMVVPDDYNINDPNLIEAISEGVKQDLVNVFDDNMVTIQEIKAVQDVPPSYLDVEPWLAPDVDVVEAGDLTCKQLLECSLCDTDME